MTPFEEYIARHNLEVNPSDYGFETEPEISEEERPESIRVVNSRVNAESLWLFFIHHYNLEDWTRREGIRYGSINSLGREQQLVFREFPYLFSIWENWQTSTPEFFQLITRN